MSNRDHGIKIQKHRFTIMLEQKTTHESGCSTFFIFVLVQIKMIEKQVTKHFMLFYSDRDYTKKLLMKFDTATLDF